MGNIKILMLIGQEIVRIGLRTLLQETKEFSIVGEAEDFKHAARLLAETKPGIVIIDFSQSPSSTGEMIRTLKHADEKVKVLIYTNDEREESFFQAFHSGADGYLLRTGDSKTVIDALHALNKGELFFGPHISELMLKQFLAKPHRSLGNETSGLESLTKREVEILTLIALGMTNQEIAEKLFISFRTVHTHRTNLMKKLNAHGTAQLVRFAIEHGLVTAKSVNSIS